MIYETISKQNSLFPSSAVTAFASWCCKKGICTAWSFPPWLVLSSHISHGTTAHIHHNRSKTHQHCKSLHSSHKGSHHAHLPLLHSFHQVTWYFLLVHQLTSATKRRSTIRLHVNMMPLTSFHRLNPLERYNIAPLYCSLICYHCPRWACLLLAFFQLQLQIGWADHLSG